MDVEAGSHVLAHDAILRPALLAQAVVVILTCISWTIISSVSALNSPSTSSNEPSREGIIIMVIISHHASNMSSNMS